MLLPRLALLLLLPFVSAAEPSGVRLQSPLPPRSAAASPHRGEAKKVAGHQPSSNPGQTNTSPQRGEVVPASGTGEGIGRLPQAGENATLMVNAPTVPV